MCCPRDCVSRHNGGTSGATLKPLRVDSALRALSTNSALRALSSLRGLRGTPEVPPLCRETQSLGQHMLELSCENATVGKNGLREAELGPHDAERRQPLGQLILVVFPVRCPLYFLFYLSNKLTNRTLFSSQVEQNLSVCYNLPIDLAPKGFQFDGKSIEKM